MEADNPITVGPGGPITQEVCGVPMSYHPPKVYVTDVRPDKTDYQKGWVDGRKNMLVALKCQFMARRWMPSEWTEYLEALLKILSGS